MRSEYSRVAFAALDNLIDNHYIIDMRKRELMRKWDTEDKIEREVERQMDKLDRLLMKNDIDMEEYDYQVEEINLWATLRYREIR